MIGRHAIGPAVLVPARVALLLEHELRIADRHADYRDRDPEVASVLASWVEAARHERERLNGRRSFSGTTLGEAVPAPASSQPMTVRDVTRRANATGKPISERGVRAAVQRRTLTGTLTAGAYLFAEDDVADWLARRNGATT